MQTPILTEGQFSSWGDCPDTNLSSYSQVKAWILTKNRLYHSLKLKANSLRESITNSLTAIYNQGLKLY